MVTKVKVLRLYRFRKAITSEGYFEHQLGQRCAGHSVNNLFGKLLVFSEPTNKYDLNYYFDNEEQPINMEVIKNNNKRFGFKFNLREQSGFTNYSYSDLKLVLQVLGYGIGPSESRWKNDSSNENYFIHSEGAKYHKSNVAGWICNTGMGHWFAVRYTLMPDGSDSFLNVDSMFKGGPKKINGIINVPKGYIVYYDYVFSTEKFDNGDSPGYWNGWFRRFMEEKGYTHQSARLKYEKE